MSLPQLPIHNLDQRHPGLLSSTAANYLDAARVCLDRHHTPPIDFTLIDNNQTSQAQIHWIPTNDRDRNAWANLDDATRDGAYGLALAAIEHLREFVAIRRAEGRTGADYYIMPIDGDPEDLETWYRLEISGTHLGTPEINRRLRQKLTQARFGNSPLPAIAAVVGFKEKKIIIQTLEENL
jgi:hypothetical protein